MRCTTFLRVGLIGELVTRFRVSGSFGVSSVVGIGAGEKGRV